MISLWLLSNVSPPLCSKVEAMGREKDWPMYGWWVQSSTQNITSFIHSPFFQFSSQFITCMVHLEMSRVHSKALSLFDVFLQQTEREGTNSFCWFALNNFSWFPLRHYKSLDYNFSEAPTWTMYIYYFWNVCWHRPHAHII